MSKLEKVLSCPVCESTSITTEKRINGNSKCIECKHKDKTSNFNYDTPTFKQYLRMNDKGYIIENKKENEKGIYVAVKYNQSANDDLMDFIKKYNIPSVLKPEDFHTTLIYSRKYAEINELDDNLGDNEIVAYPKGLEVFETFDKKRALVIKLDCNYLEDRHKYLMGKYELTYDYPEYIPHITLSYDIGEMILPKNVEFPKFFRISSEYQEELDLKKKYK